MKRRAIQKGRKMAVHLTIVSYRFYILSLSFYISLGKRSVFKKVDLVFTAPRNRSL